MAERGEIAPDRTGHAQIKTAYSLASERRVKLADVSGTPGLITNRRTDAEWCSGARELRVAAYDLDRPKGSH